MASSLHALTNTTSKLTRDQRAQIAYAADDVLLPFLSNGTVTFLYTDSSGNQPIYDLNFSGIFGLRALARTDFLTGKNTFNDVTTAYLTSTAAHLQNASVIPLTVCVRTLLSFPTVSHICLNDKINAALVGLVAMDVHFAYNDSTALTIADSLWNQLFSGQMQSQQASAGTLQNSIYNVTFSSSCNSQSVAGAVFTGGWPQWGEAAISTIGAADVGSYFALSSQLYKATANATYLASAVLAAQFIQYHLYSAQIIQSSLDISTCVSNSTQRPDTNGFVLEGLAALSSANYTEFNPM
ncbi:hypothetical protein EIP86_010737 [Pleurotus ostreatoroseus]|nr:hypothetical protein EIP86_010737 [Pleurotus ostreatoroseus]